MPDGRQALVFDDGAEPRVRPVGAVRDRPPGRSVLKAPRRRLAAREPFARGRGTRLLAALNAIVDLLESGCPESLEEA